MTFKKAALPEIRILRHDHQAVVSSVRPYLRVRGCLQSNITDVQAIAIAI